MDDELLTVRQVAQIFRVDDTTVRRWIRNKALDAIVLPNNNRNHTTFRIRRESVNAILEKGNHEQQI